MFRAGVDRKLVKEATGHASDAVDKYQITSDVQREKMSEILAKNPIEVTETLDSKPTENETEASESASVSVACTGHTCCCNKTQLNPGNVGEIIQEIVKKNSESGKTSIRIQIEITKE